MNRIPTKVLITGGAGFIGSHICDRLVEMGVKVICVDNLITGNAENISHLVGNENFEFLEGDITDFEFLLDSMEGCDSVNHQAAIGSVPRSVEDPLTSNLYNVDGTLNVFFAAKESGIKRVVFASSSSVYGDEESLPKVEGKIGVQLSPYAVTKRVGELYANVFNDLYGMEMIGMRYFNIFGPRQSPDGAYAAVIPKFIKKIIEGEGPVILGDGEQSRDFTYVSNAVDANIAALMSENNDAFGRVYNIACGSRLTINQIFSELRSLISKDIPEAMSIEAVYEEERAGDVKHSLADISLASEYLGYEPMINPSEGLMKTVYSHISEQRA